MHVPARLLLVLAAVVVPSLAAAQTMGPNACMNCHDHEPERLWATTKDGPPPKGHIAALKQLESAKARTWLRKLGITQPYAPASGCVRCHATVVAGDAVAGVTCESCHGPGKGYAVVHQDKGAYQAAVDAGMYDTRGKPQAWVPICVSCHVVDDRKLIKAGHPGGDTFDPVAKVGPVVHWKRTEAEADIAAAARTAVAAALARRTGPAASATPAGPAAAPTAAPPAAGTATALDVADLRLLAMLEALLRRGAYTPRPLPKPAPLAFSGPDAAWRQLQQDVINLAIEALATPPPAPAKKGS